MTEQEQPVAAGRPWVHSWLIAGLQHLCYTDLLVAYSRWQLRTWGLAVWSTLLQTVKMLPGLFVGDYVQNSGTCTLCSPCFLPLQCLFPAEDNHPALFVFSAPVGGGRELHRLMYIILFLLI